MKKKIYLTLSLDIIHHGHIRIIEHAKSLGDLTVGLLTDKAVSSHKRMPLLNYDQRKEILKNIEGVSKIIPQTEWEHSKNILRYKPDIVVAGDDWKLTVAGKILRKDTVEAIKKIGAKLIEFPHTKNISSHSLQNRFFKQGLALNERSNYFRRLIDAKDIVRILETHSPLSAMIAQNVSYTDKNKKTFEFDGFWSSSLTDSTLRGKPDIEILDLRDRLQNINDIFDVTTKPLVIDIDTGGKTEHLEINIKTIERSGVSAVIMEDKKGLKKNSLFGTKVKQEQESIKEFSNKIKKGKNNVKNLMIIARVESLILNKPIKDAISRAENYVNSGADGIMIHSRSDSPKEIFNFAEKFKKKYHDIPLVAVPSSYNKTKEIDLINNGFNVVIYANHMLRASYPAMKKVALEILKNKRSFESDKSLLSIKKILDLIPGTK